MFIFKLFKYNESSILFEKFFGEEFFLCLNKNEKVCRLLRYDL